eukprot:2089572-Rhodomonas_salina.1
MCAQCAGTDGRNATPEMSERCCIIHVIWHHNSPTSGLECGDMLRLGGDRPGTTRVLRDCGRDTRAPDERAPRTAEQPTSKRNIAR